MSIETIGIEGAILQPAAAEVREAGKVRLLYIDNIRTALISLVVLTHLATTYGFEGDWYYYEGGEVIPVAYFLLLLLQAIGAAFAMGLFFLIAGYFTPRAYDRKGGREFLVDRIKRLGIPLVFYEIAINPILHYATAIHKGEFQGSFWRYLPIYPGEVGIIGDGPVWFLEALLIFSCLYALWKMVTEPAQVGLQSRATQERAAPGNGAIALFALTIGLTTFVVRIWAPVLRYYEPWHLEFAHFPQYIAMFVIGILAFRRNWRIESFQIQAKTWRWIALLFALLMPALAVAAGGLTGSLDERGAGGLNWLSLAYSVWEGFMCVAMSVTVTDWFSKRFNQQGRLAKAMSDSCFGVYVLHPAIIVPLALALSGIQMNLSLKFILVAPVAMTFCYLVAYYARKLPLLRSIL